METLDGVFGDMMTDEELARYIALLHGGKSVARKDGETWTVARFRGYPSGIFESANGLSGYVDNHWKEYLPAAKACREALIPEKPT